jgi:hypothetical protein
MLDAVIAVEKPLEIEICHSEEQTDQTELVVLKGGFSTSDHSYKFEIKSDGTGEIFYSDFDGEDAEEFAHEIKTEELAAEIEKAICEQIDLQRQENCLEDGEIEAIRNEISGEMLEEVFWEQINPTLEDPFFRSTFDDVDWGEEFQTEKGTVDDLLEFLKLCALTEKEISSPEDFLVVEAETEIDCACLSECSYYSERLGELVEIACEYFRPSGFRYDYNDGCYDRQSGYCLSSESISVSLADAARAPVREKMLGMVQLKKRLAAMEVEAEKIERLTAF